MTKKDIIETLNNYNLDKKKYIKQTTIKIDNNIAKNNLLLYYNLNKNLGFDYVDKINIINPALRL